jgi:uncharacterized protein HemY
MKCNIAVLAAVLAAAVLAGPATAGQKADKIAITPSSPAAVLIIKSTYVPIS